MPGPCMIFFTFLENMFMFSNKDLFKRNGVWLGGGKNELGTTGASKEELVQSSGLKWQVITRQCPIKGRQRTVLGWHRKTISRLFLFLENREFPNLLRGKGDFDHFAQSNGTLQPLQGVLSEGPFIQVSGSLLSAFSPLIHGALISHSLPLANTAWACNPIPEVTVSKDTRYLWTVSVCLYILICYLNCKANWGDGKENSRAEGISISCLNRAPVAGCKPRLTVTEGFCMRKNPDWSVENALAVLCQPP